MPDTSPATTPSPVAPSVPQANPSSAGAQPQAIQLKLPSVEEAITYLEALAQKWIENYKGQMNHNPYVQVAKHITPILQTLKVEGAEVTQQIFASMKTLEGKYSVIDAKYTPPTPQEISAETRPMATAKSVGARNAGVNN